MIGQSKICLTCEFYMNFLTLSKRIAMDPNPNQVKDEKTFQRDFKNLDLGD
jgi:hypothetical protein